MTKAFARQTKEQSNDVMSKTSPNEHGKVPRRYFTITREDKTAEVIASTMVAASPPFVGRAEEAAEA